MDRSCSWYRQLRAKRIIFDERRGAWMVFQAFLTNAFVAKSAEVKRQTVSWS
jgi:hypothetical protein